MNNSGYIIDNKLFPSILHWDKNHYVVLIRARRRSNGKIVFKIADPGAGIANFGIAEINRCWINSSGVNTGKGIMLCLQPNDGFEGMQYREKKKWFFPYILQLKSLKNSLIQVIVGTVGLSILQYTLPFMTQSIVDIGISDRNISFIELIVIAQLIVFLSQFLWSCIRGWLAVHLTTNINLILVSSFLEKLMRLPLRYFDSRSVGDILQRIGDHGRVQLCVSSTSIMLLFAILNIIVFSAVLMTYSSDILLIFTIGSVASVIWSASFKRVRRELDMRRFTQMSGEQSAIIELISGMPDIKLNNCEKEKEQKWIDIQLQIYRLGVKGLTLGQIQQGGTVFITQAMNIAIYLIIAQKVIGGGMTLGMMVAITYIIGQLSGPVGTLSGSIKQIQETQMSMERIRDIHTVSDEDEDIENKKLFPTAESSILVSNVSFSYTDSPEDSVLHNVTLEIPYRKTTAIVGHSGCGKTTLLKLILGFYSPQQWEMKMGGCALKDINPHSWRERIGAVLQESYVFSDTIKANIALGSQEFNPVLMKKAIDIANLSEFVSFLPQKYDTKIGRDGIGLSRGQLQGILIARAIYKNPPYIFLDEATNALDAKNEMDIMNKILSLYKGRTLIISAHRLSTIKTADNIIVLENGRIVEQGSHNELMSYRGKYYNLVYPQIPNE